MSFILPPPTLEGTVYLSVTPGSKEVPLAYLCGACGLTLRPKMGAGENGMAGSLTYPSEHCICGAKTGSENAKWTLLALPGTDTQKMEKLEPEVEETPNRAPHLSVDLGNSLTENIFAETGFSMLHVNWNLDDVRRTGIFSAP
jgi:rubredoxin